MSVNDRRFALILFFVVPAALVSNMVAARWIAGSIPPVATAFWRWGLTLIFLLPFAASAMWRGREEIRREWRSYLLLGFLGMGICGAPTYVAGVTTTATNAGLIYAACPVLIVLFARFGYGEAIGWARMAGIALALAGAGWILLRGEPSNIVHLNFVEGDLLIALGAVAWAIYSVQLKYKRTTFDPMTRLATIVAFGVAVNLPFLIGEMAFYAMPNYDLRDWTVFVFLALVPGIMSYLGYSIVVGALGAGAASLLMYLVPLYGPALAWIVLDERLAIYHLVGAAMLLPGLYLGTRR
ncbi:MAG: DMT family transporter [Alphaproteobacteria bacterium]|nr:DMT family transporter [Alphaproteobacteria bacterium]